MPIDVRALSFSYGSVPVLQNVSFRAEPGEVVAVLGPNGEIPDIKSMVPFAPFDFYIKRKLYIHNMGHATCAYLGDLLGLEYIYQSIDVPEVRIVVQNAMIESAMALHKKYDVALDGILMHITDLLHRFTNAALKDTCKRVGGDPGSTERRGDTWQTS